MGISVNVQIDEIEAIICKLNKLGDDMAGVVDVINAVREEQSLIKGALVTIERLVVEAKQLLAAGKLEDLDALLTDIQANSEALVAANISGTEAANLIDQVNGDPIPPVV